MALYLIHGALGSADQVHPLRELLTAIPDVRVVELAGHGATPIGDREFSIQGFADQFAERLEADQADRADVFGYSMGGYVALAVAHQHPGRIGRVITLGTKFEWTPEVGARVAAWVDHVRIRSRASPEADALQARHVGAGGWEANLVATAALLRALGERPYLDADVLGGIAQPVLIIAGDRDGTLSSGESARAAALLAHGASIVLPDTPHPFERVDHGLLASAVINFLTS